MEDAGSIFEAADRRAKLVRRVVTEMAVLAGGIFVHIASQLHDQTLFECVTNQKKHDKIRHSAI